MEDSSTKNTYTQPQDLLANESMPQKEDDSTGISEVFVQYINNIKHYFVEKSSKRWDRGPESTAILPIVPTKVSIKEKVNNTRLNHAPSPIQAFVPVTIPMTTDKRAVKPRTRKVYSKKTAYPYMITGFIIGLIIVSVLSGVAGNFAEKLLHYNKSSSANPIQALTKSSNQAVDAQALLVKELYKARQWATAHNGSFTGFVAGIPIKSAAGGEHLVLTVLSNGLCWSTGQTPGYPKDEVRDDPTGKRCDPSNLAKLQQGLSNLK